MRKAAAEHVYLRIVTSDVTLLCALAVSSGGCGCENGETGDKGSHRTHPCKIACSTKSGIPNSKILLLATEIEIKGSSESIFDNRLDRRLVDIVPFWTE